MLTRAEARQAEMRAQNEPEFDYFDYSRPERPKHDIGKYVARGYKVPIIDNHLAWRKAFDDGTAMIRSELWQDYDGLSGLLRSQRVGPELPRGERNPKIAQLALEELRNGRLDPATYMAHYARKYDTWSEELARIIQEAAEFGGQEYVRFVDPWQVSASKWRYIEGTNVSIFADPSVEGRYHFGVKPPPTRDRDYRVTGLTVDIDDHDESVPFFESDYKFVARPFIELYEGVRAMPRFDNTNCPVIEAQQDKKGNLYFLQYLKTRHVRNFVDPFDLPESETAMTTTDVRGATTEDGEEMRLYLSPRKLSDGMRGQAILCSFDRPRYRQVQLASCHARLILHEAYISFTNNHFDSSPMYRPPIAAGLESGGDATPFTRRKAQELCEPVGNIYNPEMGVRYVDIRLTSNGRRAVIESDWVVSTADYQSLP